MELVHDRRGSGDPLVLLHGIGSRWQVFEPVIDLLAADFEVWSVDMPGFGASAPLPGRTDIAALTDAVHEWMGKHGIRGAHVAGNSTGGGVALELAARGAVASACALAPIGFWSARERAFCQASVGSTRKLSRVTRPMTVALAGNPVTRTMLLGQMCAKPWRVSAEALVADVDALIGAAAFDDVNHSFTGYLAPADAADRVPVTIVWGARDRLLLPRQATRARARLPRARHVMISGAGHLMMGDQPEAVAEAIRAATRAPAPLAG